ncbi:Protein RibT [Apilactobacillus kunkeei]|uniref:hypothetical protein n=1 Tax=Apilactobacillus TaxID=2767877 RepID=UPI0006B25085|nr:hypothetical protein [Apilactobacillus kunkeei]KOY74480.1 RibT protein [Apilactobacillus kunkeei]KOY77958.1 RibT protein [Apilactobacillus kunkeei]MCK8618336.1 hypothetical protein [Apilactobacillus kunkeei]CAI2604305.1 Protein RibT [Apilactobacillus kunkeei]CAI2604959.1 Protein RibT [Apilactobacillus kunkeei]
MLLKYRTEYKKIAMDMLSLLPDMNKGNHLEDEMNWYEDSDNRVIYLWKNQDDNWAGLVAIEQKNDLLVLRRVVLTPDSWNINNCCSMINDLNNLYMGKKIVGTMDTTSICEIWEKRNGTRVQ